MAKISANGATKLAERRRKVQVPAATLTGYRTVADSVAVLCSDGRVLTRLIHSDGVRDGYLVAVRIRNGGKRDQTTLLDIFHAYCDRRGYDGRVGRRDLSQVDV